MGELQCGPKNALMLSLAEYATREELTLDEQSGNQDTAQVFICAVPFLIL